MFSREGKFCRKIGSEKGSPGCLQRPRGLAFDFAKNLLVADAGLNRVLVFRADGMFLLGFGSRGPGPQQFYAPYDIVVDSAGRILVSDHGNGRIAIFVL